MSLKCFIAMAFDKDDTDRLYAHHKRLLKVKGWDISLFRVDQSNRNDDIDNQIMSELKRCDFAIVDLTYARPSVYFEAGVAQGRDVPVIYTCRKDHFKPKPDDKHGNFRVHFDLQMKSIIPWSDPPGDSFSRKLAKRIALVISPLVKKAQENEQRQKNEKAFQNLSVRARRERLNNICKSIIRKAGFKNANAEQWPGRIASGRFILARHLIINRLKKAELENLATFLPLVLRNQIEDRFQFNFKCVTLHIFYISLESVTRRMVELALPEFQVTESMGELKVKYGSCILRSSKPLRTRGLTFHGERTINVQMRIHILSKIESEPKFKQMLQVIFEGVR